MEWRNSTRNFILLLDRRNENISFPRVRTEATLTLYHCTMTTLSTINKIILLILYNFRFSVSFTPIVTLTSEFCHNGIRDRIMLLQSSFASISQAVVALTSWVILPQQWKHSFFNGYIGRIRFFKDI